MGKLIAFPGVDPAAPPPPPPPVPPPNTRCQAPRVSSWIRGYVGGDRCKNRAKVTLADGHHVCGWHTDAGRYGWAEDEPGVSR